MQGQRSTTAIFLCSRETRTHRSSSLISSGAELAIALLVGYGLSMEAAENEDSASLVLSIHIASWIVVSTGKMTGLASIIEHYRTVV